MPANFTPTFPKELRGFLNQPGALTVTEFVENLRQQRTPFHDQLAESMDRHQQYLDALGTVIGSVLRYLQQLANANDTTSGGAALHAKASGTQALNTSFVDIPGATVTLDRNGTWMIIGCVNANPDQTGGDTATIGQCLVDGVAQSGLVVAFATGNPIIQGAQTWLVANVVGGQIAKLQAKNNTGAGGSFTGADSSITAVWISEP